MTVTGNGEHVTMSNAHMIGKARTCHETSNKLEMSCKYEDVQPYLEYIENMLLRYFRTHGQSFLCMFHPGFAMMFRLSPYYNQMTVQEVVKIVLYYYRQIQLQYSFYCQNNEVHCKTDTTCDAEITALINNLETAVCQNNWKGLSKAKQYLHPYQQDKSCKTHKTAIVNNSIASHGSMHDDGKHTVSSKNFTEQNVVDVVMSQLTNMECCNLSHTRNVDKHKSMLSFGFKYEHEKENLSRNDRDMSNNLHHMTQHVLKECDITEVDKDFFKEMQHDGQAICDGKYNDVESENALQTMFDDETELRMLDMFYGTNSNDAGQHVVLEECDIHQRNLQSGDNKKNNDLMDLTFHDCNLDYDVVLYQDVVKKKYWKYMGRLTNVEKNVVEKCILQCNDYVEMHQMTISQAIGNVENVLKYVMKCH